jgi:hypothetical protein
MTILIDNAKMTFELATELMSEPDNRDQQIVSAWDQSRINHHFENKKSFKKAFKKTRKTLKFPAKIATLFKACNYLFSKKAKGTEVTRYFECRVSRQTGRLRLQHPKGPLTTIDETAKTHRFLSKKRFDSLEKWRGQLHGDRLAYFYICKERLTIGKHHLEFAYDGRKISGWHLSEGMVNTNRRDIERRVRSALKEILGIRDKRIT